jgi:hypothetical protein
MPADSPNLNLKIAPSPPMHVNIAPSVTASVHLISRLNLRLFQVEPLKRKPNTMDELFRADNPVPTYHDIPPAAVIPRFSYAFWIVIALILMVSVGGGIVFPRL